MSPVIYCAIFFKKNSVINGSKEVVPISIIEIEDLDYFDMNGKGTHVQYGYDDYGNLVSDPYKEITDISYNHLNLPVKITFGSGGKIEYFYACPPYWWDATGVKLKKKVTDGTTITTTDYMDGFQYTNGKLDFFPHAEGYVKAIPSGLGGNTTYAFNYVFSYTDHLRNIRVKYAQNPANGNQIEILEEDHYYPYGLKHNGYNTGHLILTKSVDPGPSIVLTPVNPFLGDTYKYKFGGKEHQDEFGLDLYDFGARNYDPALGRWMNIDPLAEMMRRHSPYNYAFDNPVYFIDPDGMMPLATDPITKNLGKKSKGTTGTFKSTGNSTYSPASKNSWRGSVVSVSAKVDNNDNELLAAYIGVNATEYNREATAITTKVSGQYFNSEGQEVNSIDEASTLNISEYTKTETVKLFEGGNESTIEVGESINSLTFSVNENGTLEIVDSNQSYAQKTKNIEQGSPELKEAVGNLVEENNTNLNIDKSKIRANTLEGALENNYHDMVRESKQIINNP